jgi:hypothetical protein
VSFGWPSLAGDGTRGKHKIPGMARRVVPCKDNVVLNLLMERRYLSHE